LVNCIYAYALQPCRGEYNNYDFWDLIFVVFGNIPASELIDVGRNLNGHVMLAVIVL